MSGVRNRAQARGRNVLPFDGPASRGTGSGAGSQGRISSPGGFGSQTIGTSSSRRSSNAGVSQAASQTSAAQVAPIARDPAREGPAPRATDAIKNIDMPASFYNIDGLYALPTEFTRRPGFNKTGKQIQLSVNAYTVRAMPTLTVTQYDVIIGSGAEKKFVQSKVWASKKRQQAIGPECIYDGNKLAWSMKDYGQVRIMVDLDEEEGKPPSQNGRNAFRIHLNPSKQVKLHAIQAYLQGKTQHHVDVLEAMNFLDHLLREGPSRNQNLVAIRRSFFSRSGQRADLGGAIEVFRGVYQSMRLAQGQKLIVNVDVANACFWKPQNLINVILQKNKWRDPSEIVQRLSRREELIATEKYLKRLNVKVSYAGNQTPDKIWKIGRLSTNNANTHRIKWRNPQTGQETNEMVPVSAYFKRRYNVTLAQPTLPLVEMTKQMKGNPVMFPMELLSLVEHQKYGSKLDPMQTQGMIKFAVSPPATRLTAINEGKGWLQWEKDIFLTRYGLKIDNQQIITPARILPPPGISFGNKVEQPGLKGRWDLKGKQFLSTNPQELVSWGIGFFPGRAQMGQAQVEKFALDFAKAYRAHGGKVASGLPYMMPLPRDAADAVEKLHNQTGNKFQKRPQLLIFLVQDKDATHYLRIKKSCECRFGVVSQVMQAAQAQKGNPQYYSNVLMKVNAKLGGCTSQVKPATGSGFKGQFSAPTMFIGADVSHASPGSDQASMAALTVSFDRHAGRYAAGCQTNGHRVEMITEANMRSILGPMIQEWATTVGGGKLPQQIYYMRDGVSEGQFIKVIREEIPYVRAVLDKLSNGSWLGKMTVIVASKRHHIRAFPKGSDGDQKGNPVPGTLIEQDVTGLEYDFYLFSHIALQGTSRPVHYSVLLDEANHAPELLQNMIYEHCYQYMRSTTSVSLHPAVYYAHLASNRAKAHENIASSQGPTGGAGFKQNQPSSDTPRSSEATPLLPMINTSKISFSMWYI